MITMSGGQCPPRYLSHGKHCLVKFLGEIIVVLVKWVTQQIIGKIQEGETAEGAENIYNLRPVRQQVVSEIQFSDVSDLVSQITKPTKFFNVVIIEGHQRRKHSRLRLRAGRHEDNEREVLGFIFFLPIFLVNTAL